METKVGDRNWQNSPLNIQQVLY